MCSRFHRQIRGVCPSKIMRGQRGVRAACKICSTLQNAAIKKARKALSNKALESDENIPPMHVLKKVLPCTALGCITCNVALCQSPLCWNMFHHSKIGVRQSSFRKSIIIDPFNVGQVTTSPPAPYAGQGDRGNRALAG